MEEKKEEKEEKKVDVDEAQKIVLNDAKKKKIINKQKEIERIKEEYRKKMKEIEERKKKIDSEINEKMKEIDELNKINEKLENELSAECAKKYKEIDETLGEAVEFDGREWTYTLAEYNNLRKNGFSTKDAKFLFDVLDTEYRIVILSNRFEPRWVLALKRDDKVFILSNDD